MTKKPKQEQCTVYERNGQLILAIDNEILLPENAPVRLTSAQLEEHREADHEVVFVDGTKLESCAGRYTFCWRGSTEKHLEKVRKKVSELTGMDSLDKLRGYLEENGSSITFAHGKGCRKSETQRQWEELDALRQRWEKYEESLRIMGDSRNSYSKTDPDATFMRMKEDHMRNGQLKPAYNVQIAVNSEYITGIDVFSNRTDFGTLIPFLKQVQRHHEVKYKEVTADAGYESLENYLFLMKRENGRLKTHLSEIRVA